MSEEATTGAQEQPQAKVEAKKSDTTTAMEASARDAANVRVSIGDAIAKAKEKARQKAAPAQDEQKAADNPVDPAVEKPKADEKPSKQAQEPKTDDKRGDIDRSWELLAQRESKLRAKEQAIREAEKMKASIEEMRTMARTDPIAFLEKWGLKVDDIAHRAMNNNAPSHEEVLRRQAEELNALKMSLAQREEQAKHYAMMQHLDSYKADVARAASDKKYEAIRQVCAVSGADVGEVVSIVNSVHYNQHKKALTPVQALDKLLPEAVNRLKAIGAFKEDVAQAPAQKQRATNKGLDNEIASEASPEDDLSGLPWEVRKKYVVAKARARMNATSK